ncbi:hypothetical protein JCM11251_000198 [Rhodosporidiobolus azoricus]
MTTAVAPSPIGRRAFSATGEIKPTTPPSQLPQEQQDYWRAHRSIWPRILTPALFERIGTLDRSEDLEPRWCKAWEKLYAVLAGADWYNLAWLQARDYARTRELESELWSKPWKFV